MLFTKRPNSSVIRQFMNTPASQLGARSPASIVLEPGGVELVRELVHSLVATTD